MRDVDFSEGSRGAGREEGNIVIPFKYGPGGCLLQQPTDGIGWIAQWRSEPADSAGQMQSRK